MNNHKNNMSEMLNPMDKKKNCFHHRPIAANHEFYLLGTIKSADDYIDWFDIIRHSGKNDNINIRINSYGGDLFTAIQMMRVLNETEATITCSVEGACMSAATLIFLCADRFEVSNYSMFMFHNYSGGARGKGGEMYDNIIHERQWSQKMFSEIYSDFLTESEIESLLDSKDIWMDGDEVMDRLEAKQKLLQKQSSVVEPKPKANPKPKAKPKAKPKPKARKKAS